MDHAQKARPPAKAPDPREEFSRFHQSDISRMNDQRVPGFELHLKLGQGGMGSIYLASDSRGKQVALKLLPRFREGHPHSHLNEWFTRECAATLAISHPNVVGSFEGGRTENYLYLSLELLDGGTLLEHLKSWGRLTWEQARPIMLDASRGLHAAHEAGIVHRDVKPENFMLLHTSEGLQTKLIDFGLCHVGGYEDIYPHLFDIEGPFAPLLSVAGAEFGTPQYWAPEHDSPLMNHQRTYDVYSSGIMLYELLAGKLPFEVIPNLAPLRLRQLCDHLHKNIQFPKPSEVVYDLQLPSKVEEIIMCALEKDPKDRFQTMEEMGRAIEAVA